MKFQEYVKPELLVLIPVLYIIGMMLKKTVRFDDRCIPAALGGCGIILSLLWVFGTEGCSAVGIFSAVTQGILVAGCAVYFNQLYKQSNKPASRRV